MKFQKFLTTILSLYGFLTMVYAGEYTIGLSEKPIVLSETDDTWKDVFGVSGFVDDKGKLISRTGRFSVARTKETLFFRIVTELPPEGELLARVPPEKGGSNAVALDDTVEIWLASLRSDGGKAPVHQLMVNPLGAIYSVTHDSSSSAIVKNWKHEAIIKSRFADGQWHVEAAIPLASIDSTALSGVRFRVVRNWRRPAQASASEAFSRGGYANTDTMSVLHFRDNAPSVNLKSFLDPSWEELQIALVVASTKAESRLDIEANIESTSNVAPRFQNKHFNLSPNQREFFEMKNRLETDTDFDAKLQVTDAEGTLFLRQFTFSTREPTDSWKIAKEEAATRFRIAYSPYRKLLLVEDSTQGKPVDEIEVEISGSKGAVASMRLQPEMWMKLPDEERAMVPVPLPELEAGEYVIRLSQSQTTESHPLKMETFGWEHNDIGKGDSVPAPFLPVHIEGKSASVLLRNYEFNDAALPAGISAEKIPLLFSEAKIEGRINGKHEELKGRSVSLSDETFISEWDMGAVSGRTTASVAFDGLVRTDIVLPKMPGTVIDELVFRIPLRDEEARLMHNIGAGIRGNYAGAVPSGEGMVWSNLDAMAYGYPENFIPYLWVGGIRRGLAVMADSSSGWSIAPQQPSMQLVRNGETLSLELKIVSTPLTLERERVVTFYWQATPIKNKPENWQSYSFGAGGDDSTEIRIHGSGLYWGAISSFGDVYPRDRDYSYLEEMARVKEGKAVASETKSFAEQWKQGYKGLPRMERYLLHVDGGFATAVGAKYIVPYTNARGVRETLPEFRVFQDEWVRQRFTSRKWSENHFGEIKTDPAPSFQDFALWHFQKMRDVNYASGIYFDNDYMVASSNPFTWYDNLVQYGEAARPSLGFLFLRDYFMRVYRLFSEDGRQPLNIMHMTNAAIAPHLAFATIQLDWEMKYGSDDFQDRFKEDVIFASTLGEQFGTVPLVLSGIYSSREKSAEWLTRSLFATTSVYEIKVWPTFQMDKKAWAQWQKLLFDFGYGNEECEVYRFWENAPFSLNREDARAIVMRHGTKLLCIVSDFGNGGDTVLTLDASLTEGKDFQCRDAETGEALPCADGKLRFDLKKHDFKIVLLEEK